MKVSVLSSGSKGNTTYIESGAGSTMLKFGLLLLLGNLLLKCLLGIGLWKMI